jgi:DNA-binding CsgD family transcriptional regulator
LPALRTASRTASMTWESHFCGELLGFESLGRGALLLDAQSRVLALNSCTQLGDGLDIANGSLRAVHLADRQKLGRALAATIAAARSGTPSASMCVVRRPSGSLPWVLDVIACKDAMVSLHSRAAALLLITDLERPSRMSRLRLQEIFGLTMTEAKLAQELASGRTLQEAAARLAISVGHARQRLKSVFHKTGVSRQPELVALLAKLI